MLRFFKELFTLPFEFKEFAKQCYGIRYKSLPLAAIIGFIMGLVLTIQSRPTFSKFVAESWLSSILALSLLNKMTTVVTTPQCAGTIESGMGAELGAMKVTEQIDEMGVSTINPSKYLVIMRNLANTLMTQSYCRIDKQDVLYPEYR